MGSYLNRYYEAKIRELEEEVRRWRNRVLGSYGHLQDGPEPYKLHTQTTNTEYVVGARMTIAHSVPSNAFYLRYEGGEEEGSCVQYSLMLDKERMYETQDHTDYLDQTMEHVKREICHYVEKARGENNES